MTNTAVRALDPGRAGDHREHEEKYHADDEQDPRDVDRRAASPESPSTAAISATTRNTTAQRTWFAPLLVASAERTGGFNVVLRSLRNRRSR